MSDYENLSRKLLENKKLTYQDYFELMQDKKWYEKSYYEIRKDYFDTFSTPYWFAVVCSLLVISIIANFVLYFNLDIW